MSKIEKIERPTECTLCDIPLEYKDDFESGEIYLECPECGEIIYIKRKIYTDIDYWEEFDNYKISNEYTKFLHHFIKKELDNNTWFRRLERWWYNGISPYQLYVLYKKRHNVKAIKRGHKNLHTFCKVLIGAKE